MQGQVPTARRTPSHDGVGRLADPDDLGDGRPLDEFPGLRWNVADGFMKRAVQGGVQFLETCGYYPSTWIEVRPPPDYLGFDRTSHQGMHGSALISDLIKRRISKSTQPATAAPRSVTVLIGRTVFVSG